MAIYRELDETGWTKWVATRPEIIQHMCWAFPPDRLYLLKNGNGKRVTIESYSEDGTVTVAVTGEFNALAFDRNVFGIKLDDLEECDLPGPEEKIGTILKDKEAIGGYIDIIRPMILAQRSA